MKKKILDLVQEYRQKEGRITRLTKMMKAKNLSYFFFSAWPPDEDGEEIESDEASAKNEVARFKDFLAAEIHINKKELEQIEQSIVKEFKEK